MWYDEPITSNNRNAPSPSKTTSPSPADLITIGLSGVPFAVSKYVPSNVSPYGST
jgi:hypothetical protein